MQNGALDINGGDWKLVARSIKELRKSFQGFASYRGTRKVAVFGSARTKEDHPLYQLTESFCDQMAKQDFMIIRVPVGIMEAGNKGAGDWSFGVNIKLPFEQSANDYIKDSQKLISYNYFFIRKLILLKNLTQRSCFRADLVP